MVPATEERGVCRFLVVLGELWVRVGGALGGFDVDEGEADGVGFGEVGVGLVVRYVEALHCAGDEGAGGAVDEGEEEREVGEGLHFGREMCQDFAVVNFSLRLGGYIYLTFGHVNESLWRDVSARAVRWGWQQRTIATLYHGLLRNLD